MSAETQIFEYDVIIIHGAPGTGKTSLAEAIHQRLGSPWFEFGWIPEFRQKGEARLTYEEEEQLSFENLCLVVGNYLRHGFANILLTDLRDSIVQQALKRFRRKRTLLITLIIRNDEELKQRVLNEDRSSGYRDWQEALALNRLYSSRAQGKHEIRIDVTDSPVDRIADQVLSILSIHPKSSISSLQANN